MDIRKIVIGLVVLCAAIAAYFFIKNDPKGPVVAPIVIKGSDTEVQIASNLVEAFLAKNPNANISVTGGGSGVGIASLLNQEIDVANSSRKIKDEELATAKSKNLNIREFVLAIDGLSVIVNPANPVKKLSLDKLGKIFQGKITNWKEFGGKDGKIVLYGRQSTSGTYMFFRDKVIKADYDPKMLNMEGNQAIVDGVKADVNGIGYVGVGYVVDQEDKSRTDIKVLDIVGTSGVAISPLDKNAVKKGVYPISRPIFQYVSNLPKKGSLLEQLFLFEVSPEGQKIVEKSGFYSINEENIQQNNEFFKEIK